MELQNSQTLINLARSFAGESQAGLRYQIIAEMCNKQGFKCLQDSIKEIAKNEVEHAKLFYDIISDNNANAANVKIEAGFPFNGKTIEEGLKFSFEQEKSEADIIYPSFSEIAKSEGFFEIAEKFLAVAEIERHHEGKFKYLYENFKNGTLYKASKPTIWECSACGHIETLNCAWNICPVCGASQGYCKLLLP